jgi:hypothetical protein
VYKQGEEIPGVRLNRLTDGGDAGMQLPPMLSQPPSQMLALDLDPNGLEPSGVAASHPQREQLVDHGNTLITRVPLHAENPTKCAVTFKSMTDYSHARKIPRATFGD